MSHRLKVLIVDDSAVVRQLMTAMLQADPGIEVVGAVADPLFAMQRMARAWPDVIVLDVEMPRMDGITFLKKIMAQRPTPVVICSSLTDKGAEASLEALAAGASGIVAKPRMSGGRFALGSAATELLLAIKAAGLSKTSLLGSAGACSALAQQRLVTSLPANSASIRMQAMRPTSDLVVAIGASTGGTQALQQVLLGLPISAPPIIIVQHMPEKFTAPFARRLNELCAIEVREARTGDQASPGLALIAPGGQHMTLQRSAGQFCVEILAGPVVNRHRPSVDVLFRSVASVAGAHAMGVIMTGMGDDGAHGLKAMHETGAYTVAQDEASSVVYGMPKQAVKLGAVDISLPLEGISQAILNYAASRQQGV